MFGTKAVIILKQIAHDVSVIKDKVTAVRTDGGPVNVKVPPETGADKPAPEYDSDPRKGPKLTKQLEKRLKILRKKHLDQIAAELKKAPAGAQGYGSFLALEGDDVKVVTFRSPAEALEYVEKAKKGEITIVF